MIIIKNINELVKNESIIREFNATNFQHTYENFYSMFDSNNSSIIFIDDKMLTLLIQRDENIFECPLNIEPIVFKDDSNTSEILKFVKKISIYLDKTIYFPLVYEDSIFYKLLNKKIYTYERLYTSICNYTKIENIITRVSSSDNVYYSNRNVKKFENNLEIKYYTKIDPTSIISDVEKESWKYEAKQDMITKSEQLKYYSSLVKTGVATIAVSYDKNSHEIVAYRLDAIYNNKIHVLKNSYKEIYKKYSPGSYMLISDLYNKYNEYSYVDLYGGPGLVKNMIETYKINRYDMLFGDNDVIKKLEEKRKKWDLKNYNNFLEKKASKNDFNWFASGEEFDLKIFNDKNIFKDKCFTMDEDILKDFLDKYNIKYALVVLKNKMARLLLKLGVKVIYVDSLPFMWSLEDANSGKVPYDVNCYCAQKTIELSTQSNNIFNNVKNLVWVDPIVNQNIYNLKNAKKNYILINIGGLHSPSTDGNDYVDVVIKSIVELFENEKIIITTSLKSSLSLKKKFEKYSNVKVKTLEQRAFFECINNSKLFITSPGLTTILESRNIINKVVFLPPQNISQFYNVEYGKKIFEFYKEISWNKSNLTLKGLKEFLDRDEHGVIDIINNNIKALNNNKDIEEFKKSLQRVLESDFVYNKNFDDIKLDGVSQVINNIKKVMEE